MGTAKARGSYQERKQQAIDAGRVKVAKPSNGGPVFSLRQLFGLIWEQSTPAKKVKADEKKPSPSVEEVADDVQGRAASRPQPQPASASEAALRRATRRALIQQQRQVAR